MRFYTLSSKMKALISAGYTGQAYLIAAVMIVIGILILSINQRFTGKRRAFTTVTGKSGQVSLVNLKKGNTPISIILIVFTVCFSILPLIIFALQTIMKVPGNYSPSNWTLDFWIGTDTDAYKMGMVGGVLVGKDFLAALGRLLLLSLACSVFAGTSGLFIGYSAVKMRKTKLSKLVESMAFFPYLIPTIAFSAVYLAVASTQTFAFLYNSFLLLVIVGGMKYLPFASRGGINSMLQISNELEEAAIIQNTSWIKRMTRIIIPIQKSSIISGYLLPFMTCLRELSLFLLLCTQGFILSTTLDYFDEMGLYAFSSAINLILIVTILVFNTLVNKLTGASLDSGIGGK